MALFAALDVALACKADPARPATAPTPAATANGMTQSSSTRLFSAAIAGSPSGSA